MKKFLSFLAIAVLAIVTITSCSNDEPTNDIVVGQWKQTWLNGKEGENGSYRILDVRADHTFTWSDYNPNGELEETINGTWKKDGKWKTPKGSLDMAIVELPKVLFKFDDEDNSKEWGVLVDDFRMAWLYEKNGDFEPYYYIKQ